MDGVPAYAAVAETVAQARGAMGPKPAAFVNAVLRRVQESGAGTERFPDREREPLEYLTAWGSHPRWLVERWLRRWTLPDVERLVGVDNARPSVYVLPLEAGPEAAVERLLGRGIGAQVVGSGTGCVRLDQASDVVEALEISGPAIAQDPAANLVSRYADVPSGTMVADLCAAPGGKVLALTAPSLRIFAADRSESRIHLLRENARRLGRTLTLAVADAVRPPVREADVVLLDVPCTGTGTLARHPDARWRLDPSDLGELTALQSRMLSAAAEVVVPGGLLVYSTCSLEPEENEGRVDAFLADHRAFAVESTEAVPADYLDDEGCLRVTPHEHGFDGSFAARMRRAA